jgi:bifunctional non-homologous end joining protein LigD
MNCLAVAKLPVGPAWAYELKLDGYRAVAFKTGDRVQLKSRNGKDFAERYAALARALAALPDETVIDGEIVVLDDSGRPSFNLLQNYASREYTLVFYLFDLLILEGEDLRNEPLEVRRQLLSTEVMPRPGRADSLLGDHGGFGGGTPASGAGAGSGGRDCETSRQFLPVGPTLRRVGQNARYPWTGIGYRRLCTNSGQFDSIVVGYYEGDQLIYVARIRTVSRLRPAQHSLSTSMD